jgi:hypothetical protein
MRSDYISQFVRLAREFERRNVRILAYDDKHLQSLALQTQIDLCVLDFSTAVALQCKRAHSVQSNKEQPVIPCEVYVHAYLCISLVRPSTPAEKL